MPAQHGDDRQTSVFCESIQFAGDVIAADHVEDDIDALAARDLVDDGDEILRAIVDAAFGTERFASLALIRRAGGGEHAMAEGAGKLNRGDADSACAALNQ